MRLKRSMRQLLVIVILITASIAFASFVQAKESLTIERIFSDPRLEGIKPTSIKWAPDSSHFAFLWNSEGSKTLSLWIYDMRSLALRKILADADLEKEEIAVPEEQAKREETMRKPKSGINDFLWSPDSAMILIPYHADIFLYDIRSAETKRLTKTEKAELDPAFCGSSERITFARDNDLWIMNVQTGQTMQLTSTGSETLVNGLSNYIALEELMRYSAYGCSDDGGAIAYIQSDNAPIRKLVIPNYLPRFVEYDTQERPVAGDKNGVERIGIISSNGGETAWINIPLQDYYIASFKWHGKDIFLRILERSTRVLHLYLYDTVSGSLDEILREEDAAWVNIHNNFLIPIRGKRDFLWTSERDGFNHLYLFDSERKELKQLTEGKWEITDLEGITDDGKIFFVSTAVEPEQRHLFSFDLKEKTIGKMTAQDGWHEVSMSPDFKFYMDIFSDVAHPPRLFLSNAAQQAKAVKILDTASADLKDYTTPDVEYMKLASRDGTNIHASIMKPSDFDWKKKYPSIVHVHGGGYAQAIEKQWGGITMLSHRYLAEELKYIVIDIDYRGSLGYGRKFRTDVHLHLGGKDLDDVEDVVGYVKKMSYIDADRMGIWGWSYGGFLTNMAMLKIPELFRAGAAVAPVNDWRNYDTHYTEERLSTPQQAPEAYAVSSPITFAKNLKNHLLMIHGMQDDNVHFQDTVQLVQKLIENGKDFDLMVYPEGKHGISGDANRIHLFKKIAEHFERFLKE